MKYLNSLNKISGIGPKKIRLLLKFFKNPKNAWKAGFNDLMRSGIGEKISEKIINSRKEIDPEKEWEKLAKEGIRMIVYESKEYPELLKKIPNPPYIIYVKGDLDLNSQKIISVVGSRKHSPYGQQAAYSLARDLASSGLIVVSGLALGIDSFVHKGAMEGGLTAAILGNSLDEKNIYPKYNFRLAKEIEIKGLLISEYPIETPASQITFPARNRIIAGISLGTVVVEAGEKSGALLTAEMALEYNREIFSVPGSIFSASSIGTNRLIKNGAKIVTNVSDILEEFEFRTTVLEKKEKDLHKISNQEEKIILEIVSVTPIHIDKISKISKLSSATVASTLAFMEIKGWVRNIGGQNYISI